MAKAQLPRLIQKLLDPAVYPHPVERVELVQTHISYILLAGDHVYKIKKPVDFGFLDYSTLRKRLYYCRQEVILNARLCPGTYLGVSRISEGKGHIAIDGPSRGLRAGWGRVIEYAVHMRRLPAQGMMNRLLARGEVTPAMVESLADRLAEFHRGAEANPKIARFGQRAIRFSWEENFQQWQPYIGDTISREQDGLLQAYVRGFFRRQRALLRKRGEELRIRDCHGDLRSDSVCFTDGICIFDCIEFNRRLRYTDVAGDVGFLAMDLDFRGRPDLAEAFVRRYVEAAADPDLPRIITFYKCYRACVRGKVESFKLAEAEVSGRDKQQARRLARRYFRLAARYAGEDTPLLLITCGLAATGKSAIARGLAADMNLSLVSSDVVRKELAGLRPQERRFEPFQRGIYSPRFTDRTYRAVVRRARDGLLEGRSVIIDASFLKRRHRQWAQRLAAETGARFYCLECRAPEGAVRRRLARRLRQGADPSDARWEIYEAQKQVWEPVQELAAEAHLVVDCGRPLARCLAAVRRELRRRLGDAL